MTWGCKACIAGVTITLDEIGGTVLATAEGAAKAAQLIVGILDKVGIHVPKEEIVKLILDNIVNGIDNVAKAICKKAGCC